jgi:hypothetical protein
MLHGWANIDHTIQTGGQADGTALFRKTGVLCLLNNTGVTIFDPETTEFTTLPASNCDIYWLSAPPLPITDPILFFSRCRKAHEEKDD